MEIKKDLYSGQLYTEHVYFGRQTVTFAPTDYNAGRLAASAPFEAHALHHQPGVLRSGPATFYLAPPFIVK